jgi:hypothetical protein
MYLTPFTLSFEGSVVRPSQNSCRSISRATHFWSAVALPPLFPRRCVSVPAISAASSPSSWVPHSLPFDCAARCFSPFDPTKKTCHPGLRSSRVRARASQGKGPAFLVCLASPLIAARVMSAPPRSMRKNLHLNRSASCFHHTSANKKEGTETIRALPIYHQQQ